MAEQALLLAPAAGGRSVFGCALGWVLLLASERHHREAARLFGFLLEGNARAGLARLPFQDRTYERIRSIFSDNLSLEELSASMEIGAAWTEDRAVAFALESGNAGASGLRAWSEQIHTARLLAGLGGSDLGQSDGRHRLRPGSKRPCSSRAFRFRRA